MNVFFTDYDPVQCAHDHCKIHTRKMIIEYAQMLSTAHRFYDSSSYADTNKLYKMTHKNHPSSKWVRESANNYHWLFQVFEELCDIYSYQTGKLHKTSRLVNALANIPSGIPRDKPFQVPPMAMPDEYKKENVIEAYRCYVQSKYKNWTTRVRPLKVEWYIKQPKWVGAL